MNRILKTLLLWLLIASLPIRGLAAVDTSCGWTHNGSTASGTSSHMQVEAAYQHEPDVQSLCEPVQHQASMSGHAAHDHDSHKDLSGGSCAACFIGAAAPPFAALWAHESQGSEAAIHFPTISFTGFIPAGLERPPRHILS